MTQVIEQRSIYNQFPNFDDKEGFNYLLNKLDEHDFMDECWHNEAMPHVAKIMGTEKYPDRALRIWMDWQDHQWSDLNHDLKEGETYYRFNVHLQGEYGDDSTTEINQNFETVEEVLEFVDEFFKSKYHSLLADQWNEWLGKQGNIDNKEADAQEVITCYTLTEDQKEFVTDFIERWEQ